MTDQCPGYQGTDGAGHIDTDHDRVVRRRLSGGYEVKCRRCGQSEGIRGES